MPESKLAAALFEKSIQGDGRIRREDTSIMPGMRDFEAKRICIRRADFNIE